MHKLFRKPYRILRGTEEKNGNIPDNLMMQRLEMRL